jgi:hypothetical protein
MKITSIKISKLLSFGPLQEIDGLKTFNLFIGKNGSGKSNVLKILEGLPMDYSLVEGEKIKTLIKTLCEKLLVREGNVFSISFPRNYENRDCVSIPKGILEIQGQLEINYKTTNTHHPKKILFEESGDGILRHKDGDIKELTQKVSSIKLPESEVEFYKDLYLFLGSCITKPKLPLLNFGLYYIFGLHYWFEENGGFVQGKKLGGMQVETNTSDLPSGVLNCSKILIRYFMAKGDIILIDEPELHLEPRIIRRLFQFLVWLIIKGREDKIDSKSEKEIFDMIEEIWWANYQKDPNSEKYSKLALFGGIVDGKQGYVFNESDKKQQLFIASHSPVLINEFLKISETASVYEFDNKVFKYHYSELLPNEKGEPEQQLIEREKVFTDIKKVDSTNYSLLDNLGCKGSDLLQTNGVIWVEGPSDIVYIQKWLEMYAEENNLKKNIQGRDYEYQMFSGTLLDSLCYIKDGLSEDEEYKKLVSIFSFSKNAFVVIDSDAVYNADGEIIDKSNFANAKSFIKKQFESLSENNRKLGLWYKEGETDIRTMESYLDEESVNLIKSSWTKKIAAQKVTKSWRSEKKLSNFNNGLNGEIETLYETIEEWNK